MVIGFADSEYDIVSNLQRILTVVVVVVVVVLSFVL